MNPFAYWTELWLKSSQAMLEALQDPAAKARAPTVGVVPPPDAPKPAARKKARKPRAKAKAKGKRKTRR